MRCNPIKTIKGLGIISVVEHLPSQLKALGSVLGSGGGGEEKITN